MDDSHWNRNIVLTRTDRLFLATFSPLIPRWILPNHLTVVRLLLVPFVVAALAAEQYTLSVALFGLGAITDWLDGAMARTRRQITEWGVFYDPLADKLLIGSALALVVIEHVSIALGIILIVLETLAFLFVMWRKHRGIVKPSNGWGKLKMCTEVIGILLLLVGLRFERPELLSASFAVLLLAMVFALASAALHR